MAQVNESRTLAIRDKIVSIRDVKALASMISEEEKSADQSESNYREVSFSVDTVEGSSFQSSDPSIFSEDSPISRRKVHKIELSYRERASDKRIAISLSHGDSRYSNSVKVSGTDSKWVNGTIAQIERILASIKPQNVFVARWENSLGIIAALSIGAILSWLFVRMLLSMPLQPFSKPDGVFGQLLMHALSTPVSYYIIKYVSYYLAGWYPGHSLASKLKSLWPSIEIQIGPEHEQFEKQRRFWVLNVFLVGIAPLLTSIVYDISKSIAGP